MPTRTQSNWSSTLAFYTNWMLNFGRECGVKALHYILYFGQVQSYVLNTLIPRITIHGVWQSRMIAAIHHCNLWRLAFGTLSVETKLLAQFFFNKTVDSDGILTHHYKLHHKFPDWGNVKLFAARQHLNAHVSRDDVFLTSIFWQRTHFPTTLVTTVAGSYTTRCVLVRLFKRSSFSETTCDNWGTQTMHYKWNKHHATCCASSHLPKYAQMAPSVQNGARGTDSMLIVIAKIHFHAALCTFYFWVSLLLAHLVQHF